MSTLVHLTSEKNLKRIIRNGIKDERGVYCMPVLRNYYITHQWLRELKRGGQRTIVAIYFQIPSHELVLVGHYGAPHEEVAVGQAIKVIMEAPDAQGFEIIVQRAIERNELSKVRHISQVTGWRFSPTAHGLQPCGCRYCAGGEIKSRKRQDQFEPKDTRTYGELLAELKSLVMDGTQTLDGDTAKTCEQTRQTDFEIVDLLWTIARRRAGTAVDLRFLMAYPHEDVVQDLAIALSFYRGKVAREMLLELCMHRNDEVREAAAQSLLDRLKGEALPYLAPFGHDAVIQGVIGNYR